MKRVLVSWSTGKDSAWMLHVLRQRSDVEVCGLLTTFNAAVDRVAMHAVRRELVELQAAAVGLPLRSVMLPWPCSNEEYERLIGEEVTRAVHDGITHVAFGDLFLEDIRDYRIRQSKGSGLEPIFPIWCGESETTALAHQMITAGFEAVITCVDPRQIARDFAGRCFDLDLLAELPDSADPCGERGEFHTFCFAGPIFQEPVPVRVGDIIERDGFVFVDLTSNS